MAPGNEFTADHWKLCATVSEEHRRRGHVITAEAWLTLGARIVTVTRGHYARFDKADVELALDEHMATLAPAGDGRTAHAVDPAVDVELRPGESALEASRRVASRVRARVIDNRAELEQLEQRKARSRALSQLGVLLLQASRGQLEQLRGMHA